MGGKRDNSVESKLADMADEAKNAFDKGDKDAAANVRDRMAVIAEANDMPESVIRNKLSAETIRAGYDNQKEFLESEGYHRTVDDYVAAELAGQKTSLSKYFPAAVFFLFIGVGVLGLGLNITGNVVGTSPVSNGSLVSIAFLLIGIVGLFLKK